MALWGKTDTVADQPKFDLSSYPAGTTLVFVDLTEAQTESNRARGLTTPGWNLYREWVDASGNPRYWVEPLVVIQQTALDAGDSNDDDVAADVNVEITIVTQPTNATASGGSATFSVSATITVGTISYQWQRAEPGSKRFVAITGETSDTLNLTGLTSADNGARYRVLLSAPGAKTVVSNAATLTV